ncbi:MAG: EF-Tu/IF-2/RF-3 family GTPase [Candidatus Aenigmarchaeota archaeon]|nr:EF-Tu/IF-2/RF-3 family GTPase [Candidatus Aenigmarchaeota archaeon]
MNLTVGIFGDIELAKKLGKKGTENDLAIFNHASSEGVLTFVSPNSEKIQPLLQAIAMADVPVIVAKELTKEIGEIIIAIDAFDFKQGFIIGDKNLLQPIIKDTSIEKFEFVTEEQLRQELLKVNIHRNSDLLIPIDNYFKVKGVGTVILGIAKSGTLKKYDKVIVEPLGREVTVKGIQSQDKDFEETQPGMRVGLNLKDVEAEELKRGYVICREMKKTDKIKIRFRKNIFFKNELKQGMLVFVAVGLQVITSTIESVGDDIALSLVQPVACKEHQKCIIASQNETLPRIIGSGTII